MKHNLRTITVLLVTLLAACTSPPRQRPVKVGNNRLDTVTISASGVTMTGTAPDGHHVSGSGKTAAEAERNMTSSQSRQ